MKRRLEPSAGQVKWEFAYLSPSGAGALLTARDLVVSGDMESYLIE